jgi:hypothetical protein
MIEIFQQTAKWLNDNQGVISIVLFVLTLMLGWVSGIFQALTRKPKFRIEVIRGPTFCCTYNLGGKYTADDSKQYAAHKTAISLYLSISNIGSAPASFIEPSVGYHCNFKPISRLWIQKTLGWHWLVGATTALEDFTVTKNGFTKVYPFLIQGRSDGTQSSKSYLNVGQRETGIVYFEQEASWGGLSPKLYGKTVKLKVRLKDTFGKFHTQKLTIPFVDLEKARSFYPLCGLSLNRLNDEASNGVDSKVPEG